MAAIVVRKDVGVLAYPSPRLHPMVFHRKPKNLPFREEPAQVREFVRHGGGGRVAPELGNDQLQARVSRQDWTCRRERWTSISEQ